MKVARWSIFLIAILLTACGKKDDNVVFETIRIVEERYPDTETVYTEEETSVDSIVTKTDGLYICTGQSAKTYHHDKSCSGLSQCKNEVRKVTSAEIKRMKRRPCKRCVK